MLERRFAQPESRSGVEKERKENGEKQKVTEFLDSARCQMSNVLDEKMGVLGALLSMPKSERDEGLIRIYQKEIGFLQEGIKMVNARMRESGADWV